MKTWLIKLLLPSAEDITKTAVNVIAEFINASDKTAQISKYATAADQWTKVQAKIATWLKDGKIDDTEKAELKTLLLPLAEKLVKEVTK